MDTGVGGSEITFAITDWGVDPEWGGSPVSISYSTQPRANWSVRWSMRSSPAACSGLM